MPPSEQSPSLRREARIEYSYRRKLGVGELLPAIGLAIGAGFLAFYVTRLLLQRTPLTVEHQPSLKRGPRVRGARAARTGLESGRA